MPDVRELMITAPKPSGPTIPGGLPLTFRTIWQVSFAGRRVLVLLVVPVGVAKDGTVELGKKACWAAIPMP